MLRLTKVNLRRVMIDAIASALSLHPSALMTLWVMAAVCGFLISQHLERFHESVLAYLGLAGAGYVANLVWEALEFQVLESEDLDAVLATTIGICAGVAIVVRINTLVRGLADAAPRSPPRSGPRSGRPLPTRRGVP